MRAEGGVWSYSSHLSFTLLLQRSLNELHRSCTGTKCLILNGALVGTISSGPGGESAEWRK